MTFTPEKDLANHIRFIAEYEDKKNRLAHTQQRRRKLAERERWLRQRGHASG